jgi:hypothetical protein
MDREDQGQEPQETDEKTPSRPEVEGVLLIEGPEPGDALIRHEVEHEAREVSCCESYGVERRKALIDEQAGYE